MHGGGETRNAGPGRGERGGKQGGRTTEGVEQLDWNAVCREPQHGRRRASAGGVFTHSHPLSQHSGTLTHKHTHTCSHIQHIHTHTHPHTLTPSQRQGVFSQSDRERPPVAKPVPTPPPQLHTLQGQPAAQKGGRRPAVPWKAEGSRPHGHPAPQHTLPSLPFSSLSLGFGFLEDSRGGGGARRAGGGRAGGRQHDGARPPPTGAQICRPWPPAGQAHVGSPTSQGLSLAEPHLWPSHLGPSSCLSPRLADPSTQHSADSLLPWHGLLRFLGECRRGLMTARPTQQSKSPDSGRHV